MGDRIDDGAGLGEDGSRSGGDTSVSVCRWKCAWLHAFGFVCGAFSGVVGSGFDICSFACLALLFRVLKKTATPRSVVLMGVNTTVGFLWREFGIGGVEAGAPPFLWGCACPWSSEAPCLAPSAVATCNG